MSNFLQSGVQKIPIRSLARALERRVERDRQSPETTRAYVRDMRLSRYVSAVQQSGRVPEETGLAIERLLDLTDDLGSVGHALPETLRDVDPEGLLVPASIVARIERAEALEDVHAFGKLATAYTFGSESWRAVARACFAQASRIGIDPEPLFQEVGRYTSISMSSRGEVPDVFRVEVDRARHALEAELDPILEPFWRWRIEHAEANLRGAEARAQDERGE